MSEIVGHTNLTKVGNGALLGKNPDGSMCINYATMASIGHELSDESQEEVSKKQPEVLISSIAITMGMLATGTSVRPDEKSEMPELQRLATVGWRHVLNDWDYFTQGRDIGELLLTTEELNTEPRKQETIRVIQTLLAHGEMPVANENDAITHKEISFGSNDVLAAELAARMQESELFGQVRLHLLTDVNGVYEDVNDPETRIPVIANTDAYRHLALDTDSKLKIGGMRSKFKAADIAKAAGVPMWIHDPRDGPRTLAVAGEIGTYFPA